MPARRAPPATPAEIRRVVRVLYGRYGKTLLTRHSPFRVLIATVLSHRTKDEVTDVASERLFARASGVSPAVPARFRRIPRMASLNMWPPSSGSIGSALKVPTMKFNQNSQ